MSNKKINKIVNSKKILDKIKSITGLKQQEIAPQLFGISPENLSNQIGRNSIDFFVIIQWAINENVNFNWLLIDEGGMFRRDGDSESNILDDDPEIAELLERTRRVLKSGNKAAFDALERNIRYFDYAIRMENRLNNNDQRIMALEKQVGDLVDENRTLKISINKLDRRQKKDDPPNDIERRFGKDRRSRGGA